jgi:hypothetical protein
MGLGDITFSPVVIVTIWYTQGHISDDHSADIIGPIAMKGPSSDLPISPTSLAQSGTDPHKYLLTSSRWRW